MFFVVLLMCLLQQHISADCMLCHGAKILYNPFENRLCVFVVMSSATMFMLQSMLTQWCIIRCIQFLVCVCVFCQLHFIYYATNEIARALGIRVFYVKSK